MKESVMIKNMEKLLKQIKIQRAYQNLLDKINKAESDNIDNRDNNSNSIRNSNPT